MLPHSGNTIRSWILQRFQKTQQLLIQSFRNINTKVHFTFDLWTSPNHRSFLGIVTYWISPQHILQSTVLGMKRFRGRHTGENQAYHFWEVVEVYNLQGKIGYFTLDNASNNDTAMRCIQTHLEDSGIPFNPVT